jgi:hypothetical protein
MTVDSPRPAGAERGPFSLNVSRKAVSDFSLKQQSRSRFSQRFKRHRGIFLPLWKVKKTAMAAGGSRPQT